MVIMTDRERIDGNGDGGAPTGSDGEEVVDQRYAGLLRELEESVLTVVEPVAQEQREAVLGRWREIARPRLVRQLDALVGPVRPVIGEACVAWNRIPSGDRKSVKGFNVCKGDTIALITRLGRPETPGAILRHYPGCEKHAREALATLGASEGTHWDGYRSHRVFHSIVDLEEARRELRQQELAAGTAGGRVRKWWRR
jgi:hypothetical protein